MSNHDAIEPALRRAMMAVEPDYFSWPPDRQERYRVNMPDRHDFRIRRLLLKSILGVDVKTKKDLEEAHSRLNSRQNLVLNRTLLPIQGIGEDFFFLNEHFRDGQSALDFKTLHDYDYADYRFQEEWREKEHPGYEPKPYRGSLYHEWARLRMDGEFYYGNL